MKKLGKLNLQDVAEIYESEQKLIRGGGEWVIGPDGNQYWYVGEVEVVAYRDKPFSWWGPGSVFGSDSFCYNPNSVDRYWNGLGSNYPNYYYDSEPARGGGGGGSSCYTTPNTISIEGLSFIQSWEKGPNGGAALSPYDDNGSLPGGNMTIGWGHLIRLGEDFSSGITQDQANQILIADLARAINDVIYSVSVPLTQFQFDALVSYSYNIGGLSASPLCLEYLNAGDYARAAAEMDIVTSNGEILPGLVERRKDEQTIFLDGVYTNHQ